MASSNTPSAADDPSLATYAPAAVVTGERKVNPRLQDQMPQPYLARALVAPDPDHPRGTEGRDPKGMSVLQQHASFFDRNKDGIIYPWETFQGLRAIGCGFLLAIAGSIFINLGLSYISQPGWMPSLLLSIYVKNIHKCKHGSDTETYDTEGRFEPSKLDDIFSKYGVTHPDALTYEELNAMLQANRNAYDFAGWIFSLGEWNLLYYVAKDERGLLQRESVRGAFDGSLFENLEKKRASKKYR